MTKMEVCLEINRKQPTDQLKTINSVTDWEQQPNNEIVTAKYFNKRTRSQNSPGIYGGVIVDV